MLPVLALLAYAALTALASPLLLARGSWRIRFPRIALGLWNIAFLSGLAALIGSLAWSIMLVMTTPASKAVPARWFAPTVIVVFAWGGLAALGGIIALVVARMEPLDAAKRRGVQRLTLLEATAMYRSTMLGGTPVNFVESTAPLAVSFTGEYPRIIVTSRLEAELTATQLRAVLEHERAHLTHHHGLVAALSQLNLACLPALLGAREFERSVQLLIELIADDCAARSCGVVETANALVRVGAMSRSESMELRAMRLVDNAGRLPARGRRRIRALGSVGQLLIHG